MSLADILSILSLIAIVIHVYKWGWKRVRKAIYNSSARYLRPLTPQPMSFPYPEGFVRGQGRRYRFNHWIAVKTDSR